MIKLSYDEVKVIAGENITDTKTLECRVKFSLINEFEEKINKDVSEKKSLMESVVDAYSTGNVSFLIETLNHFQTNENKLSKDEITDFIDDYLVNNETDIYEVYGEVLKEFDVSGVIKKGMGKNIVKQFTEKMEEAIANLENGTIEK
ncbi:MAG: tail assembly chaperone [bacterium]